MNSKLLFSLGVASGVILTLALVLAVRSPASPASAGPIADTPTPRPTRTPEGQTPAPITPTPTPSPVPTASPTPSPVPLPPVEILYANVNSDGTLADSRGALSVNRVGTGFYIVTFNRDIGSCAATAAKDFIGSAGGAGATAGFIRLSSSQDTLAFDYSLDNNAGAADTAFSVTVFC